MVEIPIEDTPVSARRAANEKERLGRIDAAFALQAILLLIEVPRPAIWAGAKIIGPSGQHTIARETGSMLGHSRGRANLGNQGVGLDRGGP